MGCEHKQGGGFYHPRQPRQTPFYQLVERFYPQLEAVYAERYQERYGTADLRSFFLVPAPLDGYPPVHREKANSYHSLFH